MFSSNGQEKMREAALSVEEDIRRPSFRKILEIAQIRYLSLQVNVHYSQLGLSWGKSYPSLYKCNRKKWTPL